MAVATTFEIGNWLPATLTAPGLTEADFLRLCAEFPDYFLEYTADGTVLIMPPTDPETSARLAHISYQLMSGAQRRGGMVIGPDGGFRLPNGARRSPDAAWFDAERWQQAKRPGTRFPVFSPEFVVELRSPDDRLRPLQAKMQEYVDNGVQLGWLIDPQERTVTVYRAGSSPEVLANPASVRGEGPVDGFVLALERILG